MKKLYIFALVATMFAACATDAIDEQSVKVEEQTPDTLVGTFEGDDSRIQLQNGKTVWTPYLWLFWQTKKDILCAMEQWPWFNNVRDDERFITFHARAKEMAEAK